MLKLRLIRHLLITGWILSSSLLSLPILANDCSCPEEHCDSECEDQVSVSFYTEKCANGTKLRSCRRPLCQLKDPLPTMCQSKNEKAMTANKVKPELDQPVVKSSTMVGRGDKYPPVGLIVFAPGASWVLRADQPNRERLRIGSKVHLLDHIHTSVGARVKIMFHDKNFLSVAPDSEVVISEFHYNPSRNQKRTSFDLLRGKTLSQVHQKYDGPGNSYKIRTPSAVAGVRGTQFITSVDDKQGTQVITLQGLVELGARSEPDDKRAVPAGTSLKVEVSGATTQVNEGDGDLATVLSGTFSSQEILSETTLERLTLAWRYEQGDVDGSRNPAAEVPGMGLGKSSDFLCSEPKGAYNSCSWTCEGSRAEGKSHKSSNCPTQREGVQCVRRRCTASGQWLDDYRLPASLGQFCPSQQPRVGPCDY